MLHPWTLQAGFHCRRKNDPKVIQHFGYCVNSASSSFRSRKKLLSPRWEGDAPKERLWRLSVWWEEGRINEEGRESCQVSRSQELQPFFHFSSLHLATLPDRGRGLCKAVDKRGRAGFLFFRVRRSLRPNRMDRQTDRQTGMQKVTRLHCMSKLHLSLGSALSN